MIILQNELTKESLFNDSEVPFWVVCIYDSIPEQVYLEHCKVRKHQDVGVFEGKPYFCIWGWSIWRRKGAFRTIGQELNHWCEGLTDVKFFSTQESAKAFAEDLMKSRKCIHINS